MPTNGILRGDECLICFHPMGRHELRGPCGSCDCSKGIPATLENRVRRIENILWHHNLKSKQEEDDA